MLLHPEIDYNEYASKITYDTFKSSALSYADRDLDQYIINDNHVGYWHKRKNQLIDVLQITFNVVENTTNGIDIFPRRFAAITLGQSVTDIDKWVYGRFFWNFKHNRLEHRAIPNCLEHVYNNEHQGYRCFDYMFDLRILCSKIMITYLPALQQDILTLERLSGK